MDFDYNKETWKIIDTFFKYDKYYLTKHHLDSYNDFIIKKIPQIIQQDNPQKLYEEYDNSTKKFKYETHIYYGGKDGSKIFLGHPVILKGSLKKKMYPNEARLRNLSYVSHLFCDIEIEYYITIDGNIVKFTKTFKRVYIGKIPIMLHSKLCILNNQSFNVLKNMGECPYDQGGYFIVDGQEKVIVSHERKAENKLYIVKEPNDLYSYSADIKSVPNNSFKFARTTVVNIHHKTNEITVRLPSVRVQIPLFILFRALGIESDKEILKYILYDFDSDKSKLFLEFLRSSIENTGPIYSEEIARKYLATLTDGNSMSHLIDIMKTDVFPHMGNNFTNKAYYLGYVVNKLLNVYYGIEPPTDRDSFVYKRVDLSGFLLANLFRENLKQFKRDIKISIDSAYRFNKSQYQNESYANIVDNDNLMKIFNHNVIDNGMMKAFKIGTILNKKGLIQSLNRLSNVGTISHLRRINTYGDNIMIGQRKLHPTQYGIICPVETPDGGNIGIKKHLTVTGHITFGCDPKPIIDLLSQLGLVKLENLSPELMKGKTKIFINGKILGIHDDPKNLEKILILFRRNSIINIFTSIMWDIISMEISILTDGGRCCRPLYIMENEKLLINKKHLEALDKNKISWINLVGGFLKKDISYYDCEYNLPKKINILDYDDIINKLQTTSSVIEFIDTDEMGCLKLCSSLNDDLTNSTHCEIHASLIMGILGFTIPFVNTSQAPRNVYGTGQTKQSVGLYTSNFRNRFETSAHVLYYPQKPLITTRLSKYGFIDKLPTGINAVVAICSYSGYNQDDSVIINKSSMERGLFNSCYFKTYDDKEMSDAKNNVQDFFYNPNDTITNDSDNIKKKSEFNYNKVNSNGRIDAGSYVTENDVIISKYTQIGSGSSSIKTDSSTCIKKDGYGVVDKVFSDYYNSDEQQITRVRICTHREPTLGDKFASRHGQKGVIGMVLSQEDMPYSKDGIVPDIIINPHAIPSRMTLGQLVECVLGKCTSLIGFFADATPFTDVDNNEIFNLLEKLNYNKHGDEILYSGLTGKQLPTKIFIGPTYYQRLKHMVKDKINARNDGAMTLKNRQPPAGRAIGGGLRIGEMERDAILAHGTMQFLKETMYDRSDAYETYISTYSGMTSIVNKNTNVSICQSTDGPLEFIENGDDMILKNKNSYCDIVKVKIPYNTNMMLHECNAMGISMRLLVEEKPTYKKIDIKTGKKEKPFVLQDKDKRKIINKKKTVTKKKIPISTNNDRTYIDSMKNNKIIVKNLPKNISKSDLEILFSFVGEIYDIKMNVNLNECIIVFVKDYFAMEAINQFNNELLDTSKINVELYKGDYYSYNNIINYSSMYDMDYSKGILDDELNLSGPKTPDDTNETIDEFEDELDKLIEEKWENHKKQQPKNTVEGELDLSGPKTPEDINENENIDNFEEELDLTIVPKMQEDSSPDYSVAAYEKKYGKINSYKSETPENDVDLGLNPPENDVDLGLNPPENDVDLGLNPIQNGGFFNQSESPIHNSKNPTEFSETTYNSSNNSLETVKLNNNDLKIINLNIPQSNTNNLVKNITINPENYFNPNIPDGMNSSNLYKGVDYSINSNLDDSNSLDFELNLNSNTDSLNTIQTLPQPTTILTNDTIINSVDINEIEGMDLGLQEINF